MTAPKPLDNRREGDAFALGRVLWEARLRAAWGGHADTMIARDPWPPHRSHPSLATAHELAIAEAVNVLRLYDVTPRREGRG